MPAGYWLAGLSLGLVAVPSTQTAWGQDTEVQVAEDSSQLDSPAQDISPPELSDRAIERLKRDGDRLADQYDFQGALENYTHAYTGVVSRIRGQAFSKPIKPMLFTREELGVEMKRLLDKELTEDKLGLLDGTLKVFGLVMKSQSPAEIYANLLTDQVAGFYDPDDKRMVLIVEEPPEKDPGWLSRLLGGEIFNKDEQKTTLAHELTHALQDQLYHLNAMEEGIENDDDMLLAFSALVEGDATLLMFCEMQGEPNVQDMDPAAMRATFTMMSWLMPLSAGESYRSAPAIFRDTLTFPYFQGMLFVMSQAGKKGWPGVHAIYSNPPLSTEQILHPRKYQPGPNYDAPVQIELPKLDEIVGPTWKSLGGSCIGELQFSILLKQVLGGSLAARGWDGDRYEVFKNDAGKLAVALGSVWDSEKDAREFASAYCAYRHMETPADATAAIHVTASIASPVDATTPDDQSDKSTETPEAADDVFTSTSSRTVLLAGDKVWIVEGFETETSDRVLEAIQTSQITPKTFPQPKRPAE